MGKSHMLNHRKSYKSLNMFVVVLIRIVIKVVGFLFGLWAIGTKGAGKGSVSDNVKSSDI